MDRARKTEGDAGMREHGDADDGGRLVDARCLTAVCALSLSTFVQNGYVYPASSSGESWSLVAYGALYTLAFAFWAALAHRRTRWLPVARLSVLAAALLALGAVAQIAAHAVGLPSADLLAAFAPLALGRSWAVVVAGLALSSIAPRGVPVTVAAGVGASYAALLALKPLIAAAPVIVYALLPMLALALVARPVDAARRELSSLWSTSPSELALTNPSSFPSPGNRLFACIALFEVAFGFSIQFGADAAAWQQDVAALVALALVAAWCARTRLHSREDALFYLSGLLVVFGFFASSASTAFVSGVSQGALSVGAQTFSVLTWATLAIIAARNPAGGITALATGFCASNVGATAGVALGGFPVGAQDAALADARLLALALVAVALVAYVWIGLRGFSFSDAIQGVLPVEAVAAPSPEAAIEALCAHLAAAHGLTEREGEVFALLARGRNGAFIQEECRVTRNTAKTHIRHIYQKLNVHTQQELIDLVEADRSAG